MLLLIFLLGPCLSLFVSACSGHRLAGDAETDSDPGEGEPAEDAPDDALEETGQDVVEFVDTEDPAEDTAADEIEFWDCPERQDVETYLAGPIPPFRDYTFVARGVVTEFEDTTYAYFILHIDFSEEYPALTDVKFNIPKTIMGRHDMVVGDTVDVTYYYNLMILDETFRLEIERDGVKLLYGINSAGIFDETVLFNDLTFELRTGLCPPDSYQDRCANYERQAYEALCATTTESWMLFDGSDSEIECGASYGVLIGALLDYQTELAPCTDQVYHIANMIIVKYPEP